MIENILSISRDQDQQFQRSDSLDQLFRTTVTNSGHGYNCFTAADIEEVSHQDCVKPAQVLLAFFVLGNPTNTSLLLSTLPKAIERYLYVDDKHLLLGAKDGGADEQQSLGLLSLMAARTTHSQAPAAKASFWRFSSSQTSESALDSFSISFLLESFSDKMADRANWLRLFRALGASTSDARTEWNRGTLATLNSCLQRIIKNLDFSRRIRQVE